MMVLQSKSIDDIEKLFKLVVCDDIETENEKRINEIIDNTNNETEYRNELIENIHDVLWFFNYNGDINDYNSIETHVNVFKARESQKRNYKEMLKQYNDEVDNELNYMMYSLKNSIMNTLKLKNKDKSDIMDISYKNNKKKQNHKDQSLMKSWKISNEHQPIGQLTLHI